MTHYEMDVFLAGTVLLCCVMAIFNGVKNARRGWQSLILSVAFLDFAATTYLYKTGASEISIKIGCAVLIGLLVIDFFFRAGKPQARKKR